MVTGRSCVNDCNVDASTYFMYSWSAASMSAKAEFAASEASTESSYDNDEQS